MSDTSAGGEVVGGAGGDTRWFTRDRFGLFIHWGLYALPARHEWVKQRERIRDEDYQKYFDHFDPDLYDPAEWARDAKAAGMRYAVITAKHHEGFCLWDSALTDYKAPNTPAGRDLLRPWVDAFRAEGLRIGFYYSLIDWHHPEFPVDGLHPRRDDRAYIEANAGRDMAKYRAYLFGQVRELLETYAPDILWLDFSYPGRVWGGKGRDDWHAAELVALVRDLAPDIILNDRLDLPESADIVTPEQYQPRAWPERDGRRVVWEACQTLNGSWGYDRDNLQWKSPELVARLLVDTVAKGGNLLLNVGPTARGEFDPRARALLAEVGAWLRRHGRAIYGGTASDLAPPPDCRYTRRGDRLYLHVFAWPYRHLHLDGLAGQVAYAQLLHDGSEVAMLELDPARRAQNTTMPGTPGALTLELPVVRPDVLVPVIELFLRG
ncbi:MAG TPA: alpha-L-fucosidase [Thermomicrobiales bacterium]|nr:alpha-L-fucosidase [Thermomicrobiales bacterium]